MSPHEKSSHLEERMVLTHEDIKGQTKPMIRNSRDVNSYPYRKNFLRNHYNCPKIKMLS